ncbi:MAG TPA: hypothetical protein VFQ48_07740 [Pseudonocardiaceae bacterium]|nr:hypothetical protein [Pseudonocardiaceae bacterium]
MSKRSDQLRSYSTSSRNSSSAVSASEITRLPRQPTRLEKKKNTLTGLPACPDSTPESDPHHFASFSGRVVSTRHAVLDPATR